MKLARYFEPEINRRIIKFFVDNPSSVDTARGIATWINEEVGRTNKSLQELAKAKILVAHGKGAVAAYSYTTDSRLSSRIKGNIARIAHLKQ